MKKNLTSKQELISYLQKIGEKNIIVSPKVSIIVPTYNNEKCLSRCLFSIIKQTLRDIEIIIVNDGSTDDTKNVLNLFEQYDKRIKVIDQEHKMQGAARNNGIQHATADYIGFVDADDLINSDYFEKLYNTAVKHDSDITVGSILKHKTYYKKYNVKYTKEEIAQSIQEKISLCSDKTNRFFYCFNKVYRTDLIKSNNIRFCEDQIYEDVVFAIKALYSSNKIVSNPDAVYHYIENKNSSIKSNKDIKINDYIKAYSELQRYAKENKITLPERLNYYIKNWYNPFIKTYIGQYKAKEMLFGIIPIKTKNIDYDYPIDLVYLWVNGSDENWVRKKEYWQKLAGKKFDSQAVSKGRFIDNDELKFSLRSVEKFAPWINKIYIVTDNQIPKWLNVDNPKIEVIFHEQFIPKENLPLFNSEAIECYLPYIPNLSEHFLYACDDMLFGWHVNKNFFFDEDGKAIIRLKHNVSKHNIKRSMYTRSILNLQELLLQYYNKTYHYAPHHNIDAYNKSVFLDCIKAFQNKFSFTMVHKFREENDINRVLVTYYSLIKAKSKLKLYSRVSRWFSIYHRLLNKFKKIYSADSITINMNCKNPYQKLAFYKPLLFCVNDGDEITDFDRRRIAIFLEENFPEKSSFER